MWIAKQATGKFYLFDYHYIAQYNRVRKIAPSALDVQHKESASAVAGPNSKRHCSPWLLYHGNKWEKVWKLYSAKKKREICWCRWAFTLWKEPIDMCFFFPPGQGSKLTFFVLDHLVARLAYLLIQLYKIAKTRVSRSKWKSCDYFCFGQ